MAGVPGDIDTGKQPPLALPLRHFVVGLVFLLAGLVTGIALVWGWGDLLAHVHLLLAGWVCITILGAMTQFVPVWSGTELHSPTLADTQLLLVAVGVTGFAISLLANSTTYLPLFGVLMLLGFWVFAYNIARTLPRPTELDVTEWHFAFALVFFVLLAPLGVLLAIDLHTSMLSRVGLTHSNVVGAHATIAVFGAVLTTVLGALYQLATMFTQTELRGLDVYVQRFEMIAYPIAVLLLAVGRLFENPLLTGTGAILVSLALLGFGLVLLRKLHESRVERKPMQTRYIVVGGSMVIYSISALAWLAFSTWAQLSPPLFLTPVPHLLMIGVIGFTVLGTLYHVIPFIIWVHRYSDLLGLEEVPMIDDLYSSELAKLDFWLLFLGSTLTIIGSMFEVFVSLGGVLATLGAIVFVFNMLNTVRRHSPASLLPQWRRTGSGKDTHRRGE